MAGFGPLKNRQIGSVKIKYICHQDSGKEQPGLVQVLVGQEVDECQPVTDEPNIAGFNETSFKILELRDGQTEELVFWRLKWRARSMRTFTLEPVWPVKNHQMSIKVAQNDFTRKMNDFDTFTKIA